MGFLKKKKVPKSGGSAITGPVIGIDLGTTYCCVAIYRYGTVEIIANEHGYRITPSYLAFTETERLVGSAAKQQASRNPRNTVYDAKRLIGRRYEDESVAKDIAHWPFGVREQDGKPIIQVVYQRRELSLTPEEVSAAILSYLKATAEGYLGQDVHEAVITVPAYFNDSQRQATKDAGTIAGLRVLRIINEPTAASIAYGLEATGEKNVLIYDLGGGTFDVSVLNIADGIFEVRSTAGDTHLGGEDFDNIIVDYLVGEFKRTHSIDITSNARAMARVKQAAERAKRELSSKFMVTVQIDTLCDDNDMNVQLSRAKFEHLVKPLFKKTLEYIDSALDYARLSKGQIDEVVLVGGSTRIPEIRRLIQEYFTQLMGSKTRINTDINPDEAIAYGAAVQGAILSGDTSKEIEDVLLLDVTSQSLGIETAGGEMAVLIRKNSTIPLNVSQNFTTFHPNQDNVKVQVFEGDSKKTAQNNRLGTFDLTGIQPAPAGVPVIKVTFDLDANGILSVSATDTRSGNQKCIKIKNDKGRLSEEEIGAMIKSARKMEKSGQIQQAKHGKGKGKPDFRDLMAGPSSNSPVLQQIKGPEADTIYNDPQN